MTWLRISKVFRAVLVGAIFVFVISVYVISRNAISIRGSLADSNGIGLRTVSCTTDTATRAPEPLTFDLEQSVVGQSSVLFKGKGMMGKELMTSQIEVKMAVGGKQWLSLKQSMLDAENQAKRVNASAFPWKPYRLEQVDCSRLFLNNSEEQKKATRLQSLFTPMPPKEITTLAADCKWFQQNFGFITSSLTQEEEEFPIAYSILLFKDVQQALDLLRAIYRPQNYYCLHVDLKAAPGVREAVKAITSCFPNVFLSSISVDVQWGTFSVLEPEIICMQDLWRFKTWKYFINLTGQEFPLRTNWELVQILKAYNGTNNMEGTWQRRNKDRFDKVGAPPGGLNLTKGSVHVTVNRDFVDFVLHNQLSRDLLNWSRKVEIPDEAFFSTLNHNPHLGIKGAYLGEPETHPDKYPFVTRFKNWGGFPFDYPCAGKRVRMICILTTGDLPLLSSRPELFANKFHFDYSQVALGCLAERIYNNSRDEFLGRKDFDVSYYKNLTFVTNMVKESTFNRTLQSPF